MTITTRRWVMLTAAAGGLVGCFPKAAANAQDSAKSTGKCVLTPSATEGPYYIDPKLVRADVRDGRPGALLKLKLQVLEADCRPAAGARVDIWHADAQGVYSGFGTGAGQSFLRGTQLADTAGEVAFTSVYPGWYPGRATHIHMKIFLNQAEVLTSQLYFPDALSDAIYANQSAYRRGKRDTLNSDDRIARQAGGAAMAAVKEAADGYLASLIVAVDRNAKPWRR
jgi:protocatechuate 3,4-dioxygenase beta subunit